MKCFFIICILLGICTVSKAQDNANYSWVDNKVLQIPVAETYATAAIAGYVQAHFKTPEEKLRAVYKWITANIYYSKDSMYFSNWGGDPEVKMAAILRKRKGVCDNYSALFTNILLKCGIEAVVVSGYTKFGGATNRAGHSWCAVAIEKQWLLCDPTWDAGFNNAAKWFLITPEEFIETHFPFDPLWQLLPFPLTHTQFRKGNMYLKNHDIAYNISDSVKTFLQLDTLQQLEAAALRMKQAGFENEQIKTWHDYYKMKIAIVYQEQDMQCYNIAVNALNNARRLFNGYVQYRNNNYTPLRPPKDLNLLFDSIGTYIDSAHTTIKNIGKVVENFQYNTDELIINLNKLWARMLEEKTFLSALQQRNKRDKK